MAVVLPSGFSNITLESLKQVIFRGAEQAYEREAEALQSAYRSLGSFQSQVDQRASELQNSRVIIPSEEVLLQEAKGFVTTYDQFYATALKAKVFAEELDKVVEFLTPKPRLYIDQTLLEKHASELYAEIVKTNDTAIQHVTQLKNLWGKVETLHTKMLLQIQGPTAWSIQRFCQIVDNKGHPIGWWQRAVDNCTTPVVPKVPELEARIEALKKNDNSDSQEVRSS